MTLYQLSSVSLSRCQILAYIYRPGMERVNISSRVLIVAHVNQSIA